MAGRKLKIDPNASYTDGQAKQIEELVQKFQEESYLCYILHSDGRLTVAPGHK